MGLQDAKGRCQILYVLYYLCLKISLITDKLLSTNSLFLLRLGLKTSASNFTEEPKISFKHAGLNAENSVSPEECH